jgi:AraC-like DNA-binding protein
MDALDGVLATLRMHGARLYRGRGRGAWGVAFAPRCGAHGADATFHVVTQGTCWLAVDDGTPPVRLEAGDFALLPRCHAHRLLGAPEGAWVVPLEEATAHGRFAEDDGALCLDGPGSGDGGECRIVCGAVLVDDGLPSATDDGAAANPLLAALPPLIVVRGEAGRALPWLEATLAFLACEAESGRPGAGTVTARLADILFIQAIRAYLSDREQEGCPRRGYLAALADSHLGRALGAMHRRPAADWTVAALAREACLSRSSFAERFARLVGEPPLAYLTRWRLYTAARLLAGAAENAGPEPPTLAAVARRVGYGSEAAFSNAFRRWAGVPPGVYRRQRVFACPAGANVPLDRVAPSARATV